MLIAKIERAEAITSLETIIDASDGIMVARGDLAVEVGNAAVPGLQKRMIKLAREHNKLMITATQMMESMIHEPVPTRAEVSDVANAVLDGTDAVMLSAETAAGKYPGRDGRDDGADLRRGGEVRRRRRSTSDFLDRTFTRIDQSIAMATLFTAFHLKVKAIVALTQSGSTALWMSRHNAGLPDLRVDARSRRRSARWRCTATCMPLFLEQHGDRDDGAAGGRGPAGREGQGARAATSIVITIGEPIGKSGGTNTMKIVRVGDSRP